jgi:hypothetical protein
VVTFARKANGGRFRRGRAKAGGRRRGTPNRATRAWKEFVTAIANDPELQQGLVDAIKAHPELLFKAAEHAFGRPRQALDVNQGELRFIQWPDNRDIAEK